MKILSQKLFLAIFLVLCASTHLFAQLTGTRTIGTTGTYTTFALAVADLNTQGVGAGGVIFEFVGDVGGNFNEPITLAQTINPIANFPTATNTVIFRPSAGLTGTVTLTGSVGANMISFDGNADFITVDGRKGGLGTTRNLTIINTNVNNPALQFVNGASNNQILYTKIQSANINNTSGAIVFATSTGGNNNNIIDNNEISSDASGTLANCIYSAGSALLANFNANNIISNNLIFDFFVGNSATNGVFLALNNQAWSIINNRFYQTAARTYASFGNTHRAIQIVATSGDAFTVTGNIIGFANSAGTGIYTMNGSVTTVFKGITISTATGGVASNVKNNIIQSISLSTISGGSAGSGYFVGIEVQNGNVNIGGTAAEGNSIGDNTTTGSISLVSTSSAGFIQGILNTSAGIVNIQYNKIGSIVSTATGIAVSGIVGIQTAGSGVVANNVIGSTTTANSINNTTATIGNAINVIGISSSTATSLTIDANIIANINNQHLAVNVSAITRGIHTTGSMSGALTVTNNEIYNISASGTHAGTGYLNALLGGITCNSGTPVIINSNKVYNLRQTSTTGAVSIYGIFANTTASTTTLSNNLVYNLFAASTNGTTAIYGVRIGSGVTTCANNVIRLGVGSTNIQIYYGIWDFVGTNNFYYNTVYIGGQNTSTGARSFAFAGDATNTRNVANNIFVNLRTNATASTNKHYAATFNTSGTTNSDYNIFYATGTDGISIGRGSSTAGLTLYSLYKIYRASFPALEINSAFGNPQLADPTNATAPNLTLALLSPAFQTGTTSTGVLNDYANVVRSATTPNIGAYETATTPQNATTDIFTPIITYTPLTTPYALVGGTRTLTATITDVGVGVPVSGANVPTLWYQNTSAGGAWTSVAGTLTSGNGNNGTWDFVLNQVPLSLVAGQTVSYYVVAQDVATTPNIWYNVLDAAVNHTSVSTQVTAPATPNTYIIGGAMMGTYNVPGDFNSLTKAGGIFQAMTNATIGGNIIVNITANLDENGVFGLDTWADGAFNYTLLVQPSAGTQRVISNSANVATGIVMIRINADVDNTIDGRFAGAGRFLLFRNTNTVFNNAGGTISYTNTTSTKQNILQYVVVENNTNASLIGNVTVGAGTNNVNINNCRIGDATGGTLGITSNGIYVNAGTFHTFNVQNNEIYNFLNSGVAVTNITDACVISNNVFYYNFVSGFPTFTDVIVVTGGSNHTISGNKIGGNTATNTGVWNFPSNALLRGIVLASSGATANTLNNNTIQNITLSFNSTPRFQGIVATGTSRLSIDNLTIDNIQMPTANTATVILDGVSLTTGNATISNSTFNNIGNGANHTGRLRIIDLANPSIYTISDCVFSNITSRSGTSGNAFVIGTAVSANMIIERNTIRDIIVLNTGDFRCIFQTGLTATSIIRSNRIFRLTSTSGGLFGLYIFNGDVTTSHNQIAITNGAVTNPVTINGIFESVGGVKTGNHYFNTIYVGGTQASGLSNSAAYLKGNNNTVNLRNNVFINERASTAGTGKHYAINATNNTNLTSNYNLLVTRQTVDNPVGLNSATACITFAAWKTARPADELNSWTAIAGATTDHSNIIVANLFTNLASGDLSIDASKRESWYANGKGTQIASYTGDIGAVSGVRSDVLANGGTDLGADEFVAVTLPIPALAVGAHALNGTERFIFGGRQVAQIDWGTSGTLPVLGDMLYYSGENPLSPNAGARYFNAYWRLDATGGALYDYTMTLNYDKALLGTITISEDTGNTICLSKKPSLGTDWVTYLVGSTHAAGSNTLAKGALDSFSDFTGSIFVAPLPLTLLSFDAKRQNDAQIQLNWLTTNELNLNYFVIERSYDAKSFVEVARVRAENPTESIKNYVLSVEEKKAVYFRLKFVHYQQNGVQNADDSYSKIIFVGNGEEKESILVYPNPMNANNLSNVRFAVSKGLQNKVINLQIVDNQGKTVANFVGTLVEIQNDFSQNKLNLASGVYIWRFVVDNKTIKTLKISVE